MTTTNGTNREMLNDPMRSIIQPYEKFEKSDHWNEYQKSCTSNALELKVPTYTTRFPQVKHAQLAAVKTSIYNPALPTINQMHRDSVLCKLPDEHCRFTSRLSKSDFESKSFYTLRPSAKALTSLNFNENAKKLVDTNTYVSIGHAQENLESQSQNKWFTKSANNFTLPTDYSLRIQNTDTTCAWRHRLSDAKSFDNLGRVPWSQKET